MSNESPSREVILERIAAISREFNAQLRHLETNLEVVRRTLLSSIQSLRADVTDMMIDEMNNGVNRTDETFTNGMFSQDPSGTLASISGFPSYDYQWDSGTGMGLQMSPGKWSTLGENVTPMNSPQKFRSGTCSQTHLDFSDHLLTPDEPRGVNAISFDCLYDKLIDQSPGIMVKQGTNIAPNMPPFNNLLTTSVQEEQLGEQQFEPVARYEMTSLHLQEGEEGSRPMVVPIPDGEPDEPSKLDINVSAQCWVFVEFKRQRVLRYSHNSYISPSKYVLVSADRGQDMGLVVRTQCFTNSGKEIEVYLKGSSAVLGHSRISLAPGIVTRVAYAADVTFLHGKLTNKEYDAIDLCQKIVKQSELPMVIVDAEYRYDLMKLTFYYEATKRLDFRDLLRDLFQVFRVRIWMEYVETETC